MAVERHAPAELLGDESGQSVLEFVFMLPLMLGLSFILIKINTLAQISIVNQQYARMQTHWVAFNSPFYPPEPFATSQFVEKNYNKIVLGVQAKSASADEGGGVEPEAFVYSIARNRRLSGMGNDDAQTEPSARAKVRVRDTVALCTQSHVVKPDGQTLAPATFENIRKITNSSNFAYCTSPMPDAEGDGS